MIWNIRFGLFSCKVIWWIHRGLCVQQNQFWNFKTYFWSVTNSSIYYNNLFWSKLYLTKQCMNDEKRKIVFSAIRKNTAITTTTTTTWIIIYMIIARDTFNFLLLFLYLQNEITSRISHLETFWLITFDSISII